MLTLQPGTEAVRGQLVCPESEGKEKPRFAPGAEASACYRLESSPLLGIDLKAVLCLAST